MTSNPFWTTVGVAATVGTATVGGVFLTFSTFVGAALRSSPVETAVTTMQAVNVAAVRPPLMIALFGSAVLGIAAAVHAVRAGGGAAWPTVTGAALYLVGTVGTTVATTSRATTASRRGRRRPRRRSSGSPGCRRGRPATTSAPSPPSPRPCC